MRITASLVLYCNPPAQIEQAVRSALSSAIDILSIVDNSPSQTHCDAFLDPRVLYTRSGQNLGFGAGHNLAFASVATRSDVHIIMNPDVSFGPEAVGLLAQAFDTIPDLTAAMPSVVDEAGELQPLAKALPTPLDLIGRRFLPPALHRRAVRRPYELTALPHGEIVDVPNLSGCFLAVRSAAFAAIAGFDPDFFLYLEDIDLVRRLGDHGRTVYFPAAVVTHGHARGSYRVGRLMIVHVKSAIRYFAKWGWFNDPIRRERNARVRAKQAVTLSAEHRPN